MLARPRILVPVAAACLTAAVASAQAFHEGDVYLTVIDNQLTVGSYDAPSDTLTLPACVFPAFLAPLGPYAATNDPGFDTPGSVFAPGTPVGLNIRSPLAYWNNGAFTIDGPERIAISLGPITDGPEGPVWSPTQTGVTVPGFTVAANSFGEYHTHFQYTLFNFADGTGIRPGVYALELEIFATPPALLTSEPFWFVFNWNADTAEFEAALEAAWQNSPCAATGTPPCPADVTGPALDGVPNGFVDAFDLNYYVGLWLNNDPAADLTGAALDGTPDGAVNAFDLNYYIDLWLSSQGACPQA